MKIRLKDLSYKTQRGVYFIENLITGQVYVGSVPKSSFIRRFRQHLHSLNQNKHENTHLQRSYNKYGKNNFLFKIKVVSNKQPEEILLEEQYYLDNLLNIFNKHKSAFFPPDRKYSYINSEKRKNTLKVGVSYYRKFKNKELDFKDIPIKYQSIVLGKLRPIWNKGLTKEDIGYQWLKGVPKTITEKYIKGREEFSNTMRNKSKPIYVFNYLGKFIKKFRSPSDIVDYTSIPHDLPLILQSEKPRITKGKSKEIYKLEINNILKVLKGNQLHHKGLIFSFNDKCDYVLYPNNIKFNFKKWEQTYFLNHSYHEK